ncbi:hypothetical protein B0H16DRAFT_1857867 [Mycena metata]|uniref:Glycoside hydrolase 131 catalytic N-terminal domain-containing protein n=1 Tax=Mycena metata TaxID=1033252 RepID=A0AAD7ILR6_9AGAR|nr:hypothetical protein B0H16DRAFT_1857867 [Mycena metata]
MFILRPLAAALLVPTTLALVPAGFTASGLPVFRGPSGSRIQQSGRNMDVFAPNGTLIHTFEDVIPTNLKAKRQQTLIRRQEVSATEAYTQFNTTADNAIESFNTTFVVPAFPTAFDSQIIFLSANINCANPAEHKFSTEAVLLRVPLEIPGEGFFQATREGANITLEVGQRIDSFIVADHELDADPELPGLHWYMAGFDNVINSPTLQISWDVFPQLAALQLEEEGVSAASDYPAGSLVFEQINLNLTTGPPAALYWNTSVDPTTDVQVKVDVEGSQDATVSIVFPST